MNYDIKALPYDLQWTSYNDAILVDANGDDLMDVFMGGNFYDNNIQMGRLDGDEGSLLINKGDCTFEKVSTPKVKIRSQIRNLKSYKSEGGGQMILVATNSDSLKVLKIERNQIDM